MEKLYLHMGFHKTATSSFQSTCHKNKDELSKQGYIYPLFECRPYNNNLLSNHSVPIFSCFTSNPSKYIVNIKWGIKDTSKVNENYLSQLDFYLKDARNVIISGEDIGLLNTDELVALVHYFETKYNVDVIPMACVRSPYSFHCSAAQERVKGGQFIDFSSLISQRQRIQQLKNAFGDKLQLISFSEACSHSGGPVGYLLNRLGVNIDNIEITASNEGASNEYVRTQNLMNKRNPILIKGKLNPDYTRLHQSKGAKFLLELSEYNVIKESLDYENDYFKNTLGLKFCDINIPLGNHFDVDQLMNAYGDNLAYSQLNMSEPMIDRLRDMALLEEGNNLQLAHDLMSLAYRGRPTGPLIKNKLEEYKKKLQ